jgi:hypothetical protein
LGHRPFFIASCLTLLSLSATFFVISVCLSTENFGVKLAIFLCSQAKRFFSFLFYIFLRTYKEGRPILEVRAT